MKLFERNSNRNEQPLDRNTVFSEKISLVVDIGQPNARGATLEYGYYISTSGSDRSNPNISLIKGDKEVSITQSELLDHNISLAELSSLTKASIECNQSDYAFENAPAVMKHEIGNQKFYTSKVFQDANDDLDDRLYCVLYTVTEESKLTASLLYKSNSGGNWRSASSLDTEGRINKGEGLHYTQENLLITELAERLDLVIEESDLTKSKIDECFRLDNLKEKGIDNFQVRIKEFESLKILKKLTPGEFNFTRYNQTITPNLVNSELKDLPDEFFPDFQDCLYRKTLHHPKAGIIEIEAYEAKIEGEEIVWEMATDKEGNAWINSIYLKNSPINSYGVRTDIVDSGVLTIKPFDYHVTNQSYNKVLRELDEDELMPDNNDVVVESNVEALSDITIIPNDIYADVRPFIQSLKVIKKFKSRIKQ